MSHHFQPKPKQSQAKNNDAKSGRQGLDIFQMRMKSTNENLRVQLDQLTQQGGPPQYIFGQ